VGKKNKKQTNSLILYLGQKWAEWEKL